MNEANFSHNVPGHIISASPFFGWKETIRTVEFMRAYQPDPGVFSLAAPRARARKDLWQEGDVVAVVEGEGL